VWAWRNVHRVHCWSGRYSLLNGSLLLCHGRDTLFIQSISKSMILSNLFMRTERVRWCTPDAYITQISVQLFYYKSTAGNQSCCTITHYGIVLSLQRVKLLLCSLTGPYIMLTNSNCYLPSIHCHILTSKNRRKNSVVRVRERTIPTKRPPLVGQVSAKFADRGSHVVSVTDPYGSILGFLDRSRYFFFQVASQLYSQG
jgi:hypothetical protein